MSLIQVTGKKRSRLSSEGKKHSRNSSLFPGGCECVQKSERKRLRRRKNNTIKQYIASCVSLTIIINNYIIKAIINSGSIRIKRQDLWCTKRRVHRDPCTTEMSVSVCICVFVCLLWTSKIVIMWSCQSVSTKTRWWCVIIWRGKCVSVCLSCSVCVCVCLNHNGKWVTRMEDERRTTCLWLPETTSGRRDTAHTRREREKRELLTQ